MKLNTLKFMENHGFYAISLNSHLHGKFQGREIVQ